MNVSHITATAQVVATTRRCHLKSVTVAGGSANSSAVIRDGGAAGTVIATVNALIADTRQVLFCGLVTAGIHVTVAGTGAAVMVEYD